MSQIYCPGGQCGVRHHIVGTEAAALCARMTEAKRRVSGISSRGFGSAPVSSASSSSRRTSWRDQGYEGEFRIHRSGCSCMTCGSGLSTPIGKLSAEQVGGLVGGTHAMNNGASQPIEFQIESSDDALIVKLEDQQWEFDPSDFEEEDLVKSFDREGQPVFA